jgi:lycopene beta-cyclase
MYVPNFNHRSFIRIYIVFTPAFDKEEYEQEIKQYIENLGIQNFEIIEKKKGIPMTCYPFWNKTTKRVLNIGTAGGLKQVQVILSKTLTRNHPS